MCRAACSAASEAPRHRRGHDRRRGVQQPDSTTVLDRLYASRATLHVLSIGRPSDSISDEMRNRNIVIADGTSRTGGRRDQVLTPSALPEKLRKVADELTNQYVVTYGVRDSLIPPERVEVSVKTAWSHGARAYARRAK